MKTRDVAFGILLVVVSASAFAITEAAKTVNQLGVQAQSGSSPIVYFNVVEGFASTCQWGNVYFDLASDFGRAAYAQLLAAKSAGRTLSRIDYSQPGGPGTQCNLSLVELGN